VEDRSAVSAFLQERIAAERARDDSGTSLEHLTTAGDYRAWHRFTIERWQDGRWRSAAGPASSGEWVLTVTLPLFAAASAHYRSAQPAAPRLVLLDEAFAGVDDDARATRATRRTPPYPNTRAAAPNARRRCRSSRWGSSAANASPSATSVSFVTPRSYSPNYPSDP
jgi:hypothetical protein